MTDMWRVKTRITIPDGSTGFSQQYFGTDTGLLTENAVAAVHDFWNGIKSYLSSGVSVKVDGIVDVVNDATGQITGIIDTGETLVVGGSDEGDVLPAQTQLIVGLRTGVYVGGREIRGRIFIPGFTEANSSAGHPAPAMVATVATQAQDFFTPTLLAKPIVFTRTRHDQAPVSATYVSPTWAVLRSRRP